MRYKITEFDIEYEKIVERMLKNGCVLSMGRAFTEKRRRCWFYDGKVAEIKFRKWALVIAASKPAGVVNLKNGELLDMKRYFASDQEMIQYLKDGIIKVKEPNWYQYHIYDDEGKYITGDVIKENDLIEVLDIEGNQLCTKLKEEFWAHNPELLEQKKRQLIVDWE